MCKVEAGHTGSGQHGQALRQLDASLLLDLQQPPHGLLLRVIGLHGVAGGGADAGVLDLVEVIAFQGFSTELVCNSKRKL